MGDDDDNNGCQADCRISDRAAPCRVRHRANQQREHRFCRGPRHRARLLQSVSTMRLHRQSGRLQPLCDLYDATTGFLPCLPDADIRLKLIMPCWMNNTGWVGSKTGLCGRGSGSLCTWFGVQCDADGRVSGLNLGTDADGRVAGNKLSGKIPDSIGKLERMAVLDLGDNSFTGTIPDSIGELKVLTNLTITRSKELTGSIPDSIGQCEKLVALDLYDNGLTGSIADSIGKLKALRSANLFANLFTGTIPESIGNLKALEILYLNFFEDDDTKLANQFTGTIPDTISQCTALNSCSSP